MTLQEAIKHAREVSESECEECKQEHEQLAEWLEELMNLKNILGENYNLEKLKNIILAEIRILSVQRDQN